MNIFNLHEKILNGYRDYIDSFLNILDSRIKETVAKEFATDRLYPDPLIQFNPSFESGGTVGDLVNRGTLVKDFNNIFYDDKGKSWSIYRHQTTAIEKGNEGRGFVVTSGTGSGKSLTYISTIFNYLFKNPGNPGIKAIIVYPLNALINSQELALKEFNENYKKRTGSDLPFTFAKYTGQEKSDMREQVINDPPDILLTNYMMLELLMVRKNDEKLRTSFLDNLQFLVFDELHVYKGRQGADVSLLIRRIKSSTKNKNVICIGTSATMVSGGSSEDQKQTVAKVAGSFFDYPFAKDDVIGESLTTSTAEILPASDSIKQILLISNQFDGSKEDLKNNPLAIWLERNIAIKEDGLIKIRNKPKTLAQIAKALSEFTDVSESVCREKIINLLIWAERINIESVRNKNKDTILPFKLHQFISQTGFVYLTMESPATRTISLEPNPTIKRDGEDLPIYPTVFSRLSGHEFLCVRKDFSNGAKFTPRDFYDLQNPTNDDDLKINDGKKVSKKQRKNDDYIDGYIIFEHAGNKLYEDDPADIFPDAWLKNNGDLKPEKIFRLPQSVYVDKYGNFSQSNNEGEKAWFIPAPLIYDLTSGAIYQEPKLSEKTKLISLGNEGRSTSTTILTLNTLLALHDAKLPLKEQKLMSFTDNRQDASLQAGNFNDFIQVLQLRSAIEKALQHTTKSLGIHDLIIEVEKHLQLKEEEYARNPAPDPEFPNEDNRRALRDYITYRVLQDLQRGWRYVLPNLEQTALLNIDYKNLDELVEKENYWNDIEIFNELTPRDRKENCIQILNYFRLDYAIDFEMLRYESRQKLQKTLQEALNEEKLWSLDKDERIDAPNYLSIDGADQGPREISINSIGSSSRLGRFIKKLFKDQGVEVPKKDQYVEYLSRILDLLHRAHMLRKETIKAKKSDKTCYQLIVNSILWTPGDKQNIVPDHTSLTTTKDFKPNTHLYFQNLYQYDFASLKKTYRSAEHTGQINNEIKLTREQEFNEGKLSALYCSPTMELGIDISSLNIVHMRNVPPSPANYAQRSGRAGRSGQSALVFTYASNFSPHDRHYFNNPVDMVSGQVFEPRIDLTNEELIRTHLNSTILSFLNAEEFKPSLVELIDIDDGTYWLKSNIKEKYQLIINNNFNQIKSRFLEVIKNIPLNQTKWYNTNWLDKQIKNFPESLNLSLKRWRKMYLDAKNQQREAQQVIDDPVIKDQLRKNEAKSSRRKAETRQELLCNQLQESQNTTLSEFYTFRYFASEGFLPGYNFTRLPLRVFLGSKDRNEYISRPRAVAIKEFGPHNLIYHNGAKFRVNRITLDDIKIIPTKLTVFSETGYAYLDDEIKGVNQDPITGKEMSGNITLFDNLLEIDEMQSESNDRISCMEEIRASEGYVIETYLNTPDALVDADRIRLTIDSDELMKLFFASSAKVLMLNKKWKKTNSDGYWIGAKTGFFKRQKDQENPNTKDQPSNVCLYTYDISDVLYVQPIKSLNLSRQGVVTLQYALVKAIQDVYNIESVEINARLMGAGDNPNIMLYEATEGSIGVLKDLARNTIKLKTIFEKAYEICGFDLETQTDKYPDKPKASYDDLLSYYNQPDHKIIDRYSVKNALETLMIANPDDTKGIDYDGKFETLRNGLHHRSPGEKEFLEFLYSNGIRLPDYTNYNLEQFYIQPDFVYENEKALVFVDGGIHKKQTIKADDQHKRKQLELAGFDVLVWDETSEPIEAFIERRQDIFRKVR